MVLKKGNLSRNISHLNKSHLQVAIVLGHYNDNGYLPEQIQSIFEQSHKNIKLFITDDSSDNGIDLQKLGLSSKDIKKIKLYVQPSNIGFSDNFLNTLKKIEGPFDYFAFSDQDDIWYRDKLTNALTILEKYPHDQPVLYCARTTITDATCQKRLGASPLFNKPPAFANALVQSIAGANTMVFNKTAKDLIIGSKKNNKVVSHDWWCYQIVSGAGGIIYYDSNPCLKYRQHSYNLIGSNNSSWKAVFVRLLGLLKGRFRKWNDINFMALSKNKNLLTPENQQCLNNVIKARQSNLIKRLSLFKRSGVYRQSFLGNVGLFLGIILNKV